MIFCPSDFMSKRLLFFIILQWFLSLFEGTGIFHANSTKSRDLYTISHTHNFTRITLHNVALKTQSPWIITEITTGFNENGRKGCGGGLEIGIGVLTSSAPRPDCKSFCGSACTGPSHRPNPCSGLARRRLPHTS